MQPWTEWFKQPPAAGKGKEQILWQSLSKERSFANILILAL